MHDRNPKIVVRGVAAPSLSLAASAGAANTTGTRQFLEDAL